MHVYMGHILITYIWKRLRIPNLHLFLFLSLVILPWWCGIDPVPQLTCVKRNTGRINQKLIRLGIKGRKDKGDWHLSEQFFYIFLTFRVMQMFPILKKWIKYNQQEWDRAPNGIPTKTNEPDMLQMKNITIWVVAEKN